jgi:myxalamid-type polyketide synthase MxaE and MxaD
VSDVAARALAALQDLRAKLEAAEREKSEPIAIVGLGCRFPGGATSPEAFWEALRQGVDAVREVPADRWDADAYYDPEPGVPGKSYTKLGAFLDQVDRFDPAFFGIPEREAAYMDPQQRLLLEVVWEALEHAGQPIDRLAGTQVGVFVGIGNQDYGRITLRDPSRYDLYTGTGASNNVAAGRISYLFDFHGPCVSVDTACSSSLVALHLAVQSLRSHECRLALAAGVNVMASPEPTLVTSMLRMLAPDGRCKTFDSRADGYGRGEGCGVVVLKRLADARADGDRVLAVIRGSAINQDGRSAGMTAPNGLAQQAVIREALANARLSPADLSYVETHGTGTPLGDPIEVESLQAVLGDGRTSAEPLVLGSVKTNVGHLEAAAGAAALIKAVLALRHQEIPPNLHLQAVNPNLHLEATPFVLPTEPVPWPRGEVPRRAGVSSFGWSGTNAHVILEEAPPEPEAPADGGGEVLLVPLSAKSDSALRDQARSWREAIAPTTPLADLARTEARRRSHLDHRLVVLAETTSELGDRLEEFLSGASPVGVAHGVTVPGRRIRPVFVFSGQGPQWWAMGRELYEREAVYRATIDELDGLVRLHTGWSIVSELMADEAQSRLADTEVAQPALFALQLALADLWQAWGVMPAAVVGHSVGEIAAACVAGILDRPTAARLVALRGRFMQQATGLGKMAAVDWPLDEAQRELARYGDRLAIGAINGPCSLTLSGEGEALDEMIASLQARGRFAKVMGVQYAFHSQVMAPFSSQLTEALAGMDASPGRLPLISTLTGSEADGRDLTGAYWGRQLRDPVRFAAAIETLMAEGFDTFVEVGPHPVLAGPISEILEAHRQTGRVLPSLVRREPERHRMLMTLAELYVAGYPLDWSRLYPGNRPPVDLPNYPWQRSRYWVDAPRDAGRTPNGRAPVPAGTLRHPLLGAYVPSATDPTLHTWSMELGPDLVPTLSDHRVQGRAVLPATDYVEMVLAAATEAFGPGPHALGEVEIQRALVLPDGEGRPVQLQIVQEDADRARFAFYSRLPEEAGWNRHASGILTLQTVLAPVAVEDLETVRSRCSERVSGSDHEAAMRARGLDYGPSFRGVEELWRGPTEGLTRLSLGGVARTEAAHYLAHRTLLDACAQVLQSLLPSDRSTYLPVHLASLEVFDHETRPVWGQAIMREGRGTDRIVGDLLLRDEKGRCLLAARGLVIRRLAALLGADVGTWGYATEWREAAPNDPREGLEGGWLLMGGAEGLAQRLGRAIDELGGRSEVVLAGHDPAPLGAALSRLAATTPLRGVVHLGSLNPPTQLDPSDSPIQEAQRHGAESILAMVGALASSGLTQLDRVVLVTQGTRRVAGRGDSPVHAPVWGLGRALSFEHVEWSPCCLDLDPEDDPVPAIVTELRVRPTEDQIAWRGGTRYVARLAARPLPDPAPLQTDGTVLLTGGLGALGIYVATWLASRGFRHLALMGRSTPGPEAARAIAELRRSGVQVKVIAGDVADEGDVDRAIAEIDETMPPLSGLVHAAGVVDDGVLAQLDVARWRRVVEPKLLGAWNLHRATREHPLSFFVTYSSAVGVLGAPGQGNYAAGNAFLDALAEYRAARGLPATSLAWGPWAEIGMAAQAANRGGRAAALGIMSLTPAQGAEVLERAIALPGTTAILPVDWSRFGEVAREWPLLRDLVAARAEQVMTVERSSTAVRARILALPSAERADAVQVYLRELVARALGGELTGVSTDTSLVALGLDSLKAMELKNRLASDLGITLPMVRLLEGPSIRQLAELLVSDLPDGSADLRELVDGVDEDELARALAELEAMSDEEAIARLEAD